MDIKELVIQSEAFAKENLQECAKELVEWNSTGILCDGKFRELAKLCFLWCGNEHLNVAEKLILNEVLDKAAKGY